MRWGFSSNIKFDDECEIIKGSEVRTICISVSYNIDKEVAVPIQKGVKDTH